MHNHRFLRTARCLSAAAFAVAVGSLGGCAASDDAPGGGFTSSLGNLVGSIAKDKRVLSTDGGKVRFNTDLAQQLATDRATDAAKEAATDEVTARLAKMAERPAVPSGTTGQ